MAATHVWFDTIRYVLTSTYPSVSSRLTILFTTIQTYVLHVGWRKFGKMRTRLPLIPLEAR